MKPGFALSLSFEGISLLHRAAGGWRSVGEVALDVPDLAAALSDLRDKALRLEPEGLACKLIIPNDQIRYLTLETGRAEGEARRARVRQALDGATPYPVEDLAFDLSIEGDMTHVAAVLRNTLVEAEAFAIEHRFNPVSFVAVPGDQPFLGEPFFGTAENAAGMEVEPDGIAVVVTGPATIPPAEDAPVPDEPQEKTAPKASPETAAAPEAEAPEPETETKTQSEAETDTATPADAPEAAAAPPAVDFSSRRSKDASTEGGTPPALAGASRDALPGTAAPSVAAPKATAKPATPPAATKQAKPGKPPKAKAAKPAAPAKAAKSGKSDKPGRGTALRNRAAGLLGARKAAAAEPTPPKPAQPMAHPVAQPPSAQSFTSTRPEAPQDEAERMTVFGARRTEQPGTPRHLGLILTVLLLLALAAVAAWAALFSDGGIARLFSSPDERPEITAAPEPAPQDSATGTETGAETPAIDPGSDTAPAPAQPPLTSALPPAPPSEPEADAPETTVETAGDTPVPETLPQSPDVADTLTDTDRAVLDALRADSGIEQPAPLGEPTEPAAEDAATEIVPETATETAALDPELEPEPEPELAPEPEPVLLPEADLSDTDTLYAATGIWPTAPEEPETPAIIGLNDLYIASIDRTDLSQDAVALPPVQDLAPDGSLGAVTSPAAAGTAFALDNRGLVEPTPEGAVTPDGITVYLGRPPVVPPEAPTRRTRADEAIAEAETLRTRLAGFRPRPRPGNLVEQTERTQLGGRSREELGRIRPRPRPASAQDDAAAQTPADAGATALAVASAPIPKPRPNDFGETVRSSERASIGIPQNLAAAAPAAPATVAPSIPSSASVARQATLKNEINLRKVNLIGVYGSASNRRALVRLPSGRYKKVKVGDTIDGGRVVAIGDNQLQYQKGGRNHTLKMPNG